MIVIAIIFLFTLFFVFKLCPQLLLDVGDLLTQNSRLMLPFLMLFILLVQHPDLSLQPFDLSEVVATPLAVRNRTG